MNIISSRIARLTAASALVLSVGALGASPALANYSSWAGSVPDTIIFATEDGAGTDALVLSDDAATDRARTAGAESPNGNIQAI